MTQEDYDLIHSPITITRVCTQFDSDRALAAGAKPEQIFLLRKRVL